VRRRTTGRVAEHCWGEFQFEPKALNCVPAWGVWASQIPGVVTLGEESSKHCRLGLTKFALGSLGNTIVAESPGSPIARDVSKTQAGIGNRTESSAGVFARSSGHPPQGFYTRQVFRGYTTRGPKIFSGVKTHGWKISGREVSWASRRERPLKV